MTTVAEPTPPNPPDGGSSRGTPWRIHYPGTAEGTERVWTRAH
jgi:hypothetical protein